MSNIKRIIVGVGIPRIPSEYQEVEWIQSSGSQYINTGYIPKTTTKVVSKVMVKSFTSTQQDTGIWGVWYNYNSNGRFNLRYRNGSGYGFGYGSNNGQNYSVDVSLGEIAEIENYVSNGTAYNIVNGNTITYTGASFTQYTGTIYLFKRNVGSSSETAPANIRFYNFKIYDSGILVRNMIPCYRKSDSVIGLYDLVTNHFYTNSGSGTFSKGADVNKLLGKQVRPKYEWKPDSSRTLLYLPLESNATDYSGNSVSTTPSNVTYASLGGVMCANANGSSSKISIPQTGVNNSLTAGTISCVFYPKSFAYSNTYCKLMECARSSGMFGINADTSKSTYYAFTNGFAGGTFTGSAINLNSWHIATTVFDNTGDNIYLDGNLIYTQPRNSNPVWGTWGNSYQIGHYIFCGRGGDNNYYNGGARELILENVRWSAEDVSKYYQRIKAKLGF